ncbi:Receptor-type tyrosine-protein phosphatase [Trichinella spiralis]|uniref:Receptor-type tyrosine-protein phosphatase n=1 Tax=Trichinella spiralis TaxID=6334 RepID=A0ABR3KNN9_TRISP
MPIRKFDDHLGVEQQSRSAQSSSSQYHLQFQKCHVCDRLLGWSPQEEVRKCNHTCISSIINRHTSTTSI